MKSKISTLLLAATLLIASASCNAKRNTFTIINNTGKMVLITINFTGACLPKKIILINSKYQPPKKEESFTRAGHCAVKQVDLRLDLVPTSLVKNEMIGKKGGTFIIDRVEQEYSILEVK